MIEAKMPDGTVLQFPAGTADDVIDRVARQHITSTAPPPSAEANPVQMGTSAPSGFGERFIEGAKDVPLGFRQFLANVVPEGSKPILNAANPVIQALPGMTILGRLLGQIPSAQEANTEAANRERAYRGRAPDGVDWGRLAGNVAMTTPFAMAFPGASTLGGAVAGGAATGAVTGATAPVPGVTEGKPYGWQSAMGGLLGAGAGAAGGAGAHVLGGMIAPRVSPSVRALADKDVNLTPGQIYGGTTRQIEDLATSIPGVGNIISTAKNRSIESMNRAVANDVLAPIGKSVPRNAEVGRALAQTTDSMIGDAYNTALAKVRPFTTDAQFMQDVQTIAQTKFLTPESQQKFVRILTNDIDPRIGTGPITGETLQKVTSVLKDYQRSFSRSMNRADHEVADALKSLIGTFDDLVVRTNPTVAPEIKAANAAWARLVRMEGAAASVGAKEGAFTPAQFASAVRAGDDSAGHRQYALGNALMQDLSDPALKVLPPTISESGTAPRAALMTAITGGATGMVDTALMGAYLGGAAGTGALYSEPATRGIRAFVMAQRPEVIQALAEFMRRSGGVSGASALGAAHPNQLPPQ